MLFDENEPCFTISVVAKLVGVHAQTLRYYEREGLVSPSRSGGNIRLYSTSDISRIREIKEWTDDLGLNLAGVVTMTRLRSQVAALTQRVERLEQENARLRAALAARSGQTGRQTMRPDQENAN